MYALPVGDLRHPVEFVPGKISHGKQASLLVFAGSPALAVTRQIQGGGQCGPAGVTYVVYAISSRAWGRGPARALYQ